MNVLVVDDHPLFRRGLLSYLDSVDNFVVVAQAGSAKEATACLQSLSIDIVLLDINLPDRDGFELLGELKRDFANVRVAVLTMHDEAAYAQRAFALGAGAYLVKDDAEEQLAECMQALKLGEKYCSLGDLETVTKPSKIDSLSDAERRVFDLVAKGKSSYEIADMLNLSVRTIDNHRSNIAKKLGLRGSNALMKFALGSSHII
jgi:DNA-binding NarL/FixJ family response regulator